MGNLPIGMARRHVPKEIKPLTEFLENSETFKKASLGIHNSKHTLIDQFWKSIHEAAFHDSKADHKTKLIESHKQNTKK